MSAFFPTAFDDPLFTGMTESAEPIEILDGESLSRKSVVYDDLNWPTFFFEGSGALDHCRANTRECVRLVHGTVDIDWCYLEATGLPPDDHADVIQVYGPGEGGTWNISHTTIRAHNEDSTAGLFVADDTTSHVTLDHVLFWGGPFGLSIEGDGNPCTVAMNHVYFVRDSFGYQPFAFEDTSIIQWTNVFLCDVVDGDVTNLEAIEPPSPVVVSELTVLRARPSGTAMVYTAASVIGHTFVNTGREFIHVKNGSGAPVNVTVDAPNRCSFNVTHADHDLVVAVPAGGDRLIGPFAKERFNTAGLLSVSYSAFDDVTIAVLVS